MKLKSIHPTAFTSVHVFANNYSAFKQASIPTGMTLQKLVNRCVYLYTTDPEFKKRVDAENVLQISGSAF